MKRLLTLIVVCIPFLFPVDAFALCGSKPARRIGKAVVTAVARPVGKVLKVVKVLLPPYRNR